MPINVNNAIQAYDKAIRQGASPGMEPRDKTQGTSFTEVLQDAAANTVESLKAGEHQALKAVTGTANVDEVVVAVANAELALQTVVSIRDRVIRAYEEIMRMPI